MIRQLPNIVAGIVAYYPVQTAAIQLLAGNFTQMEVPKGHLLTRAGVKDGHVYFIEKGCTRTYFIIDGKEVTNWFSKEGDITFSSASFYHQTAGVDYVEVLEDAIIYSIPITTLTHLFTTNLEIANWGRCIHQEVLLQMQNLRIDRLSLTAKERYQKFCRQHPNLVNRVNLGYIASFLGMTQQHLSSLRAEV